MKTQQKPIFDMRWASIRVEDIREDPTQRPLNTEHVRRLRVSYERLGGRLQIQPLVVDQTMTLIDGAHRLEAARQAGWSHVTAIIFENAAPGQHRLIDIEASRVRREPTPLELEEVWRLYYEPEVRESAKQRRLSGLKRGAARSVLANTDNGEVAPRVSVAKTAKQVTGLSLETLDKIAEVRVLASSRETSAQVRETANEALKQLAQPGARVEVVHRSLRDALLWQRDLASGADTVLETTTTTTTSAAAALERVLGECTLYSDRLSGLLAPQMEIAARESGECREQLRAVRVALAISLATVVSVECRLEDDQVAALRRLGAEVSKLLSRTSLSQLTGD